MASDQAREVRPEYTKWTEEIKDLIKRLAESTEMNKQTQGITVTKIKAAIKRLNRGKAMGLDEIPNRIVIEADIDTIQMYREVFERIINERVRTKVNMSENQAEGKRNSTTIDNIPILTTTIKEIKKKKKPVYMIFLDVTKASNKAWLDAIMYVMHKEGPDTPEWSIIKQLNENLKAKIQTKYGETRANNIKDSIRQGES